MRLRPVVAMLGLSVLFGASLRADSRADRARAYAREFGTASHAAVPPFARQTGLACSACHFQFLSLTALGRQFKQNGYTLTSQQLIQEQGKENLKLSPIPQVGGMLQVSMTHLQKKVPGVQNNSVALPQQLSLFLAGQLTSKIGLFSQLTYASADGGLGIDNVDLRYANNGTLGSRDLTYGLTLNNNPSVSDLWNTTPAWGWPYAGSDAAAGPSAAVLLDGALGQQSLGLTGYGVLGNALYTELGVYRSAFQGQAAPDGSSEGVIDGAAPYWRLGYQKNWDKTYVMLGTYGLHAALFPLGVSGETDKVTDIGIDVQWEQKLGTGNLVTRGTWLHESRTLDASFASGDVADASGSLQTVRVNSSYYPNQLLGATLGYFQTTGSKDAVLYANGDPKSNGVIAELDLNPWQNTRLGVQYTAFMNLDGNSSSASDNNALYLMVWVLF